jgi:hypothetical protein
MGSTASGGWENYVWQVNICASQLCFLSNFKWYIFYLNLCQSHKDLGSLDTGHQGICCRLYTMKIDH